MEYKITLITYLWDGPRGGGGVEDQMEREKTARDIYAVGGGGLVLRGKGKYRGWEIDTLLCLRVFGLFFRDERQKWRGREEMKGGGYSFSLDLFSILKRKGREGKGGEEEQKGRNERMRVSHL